MGVKTDEIGEGKTLNGARIVWASDTSPVRVFRNTAAGAAPRPRRCRRV